MVLIALALVWGVVLVSWLRSRAAKSFNDPVGTFNWHLRVLEQTGPSRVRPANRRRADGSIPPYRPQPGPGVRVPPPMVRRPATMSGAAVRRRESQRRRRDVLLVLVLAAVATLILAVAVGSAFIVMNVLCDAALAGYVALLVRMRNLAAEREMKLAYLPNQARRQPPAPAGYGEQPAYGYGRQAAYAGEPAYGYEEPAYGYGQQPPAYGGLDYGVPLYGMRRAVN